jgi:hypothetical protein
MFIARKFSKTPNIFSNYHLTGLFQGVYFAIAFLHKSSSPVKINSDGAEKERDQMISLLTIDLH